MSSPAADIAPPLAALVLAWDEATPAVRALIAATQPPGPALHSILVMVPHAAAPDTLSAEEYLPLPPAGAEAENEDAAVPAAAPAPPAPLALPAGSQPAALPPLPPPAARPWAAVRVLRLSGQPLPELARRAGQPLPAPTWTGTASAPAAPYQGATPPPAPPAARPPTLPPGFAPAPPAALPPLPANEPPAPAPAAEADWLPQLLTPVPDSHELSWPEPAAEPAAPPAAPAQAGWPEALATLRQPAPETAAPVPTFPAGPAAPAAPPAGARYDAPNLNFQVIQYARFAVPVALAEAPYAVIYAPAWPTWLAAQELRQRTGQPLVLHVAALAAPADEPLNEAAGWMAELQRQALRRADVILTETAALARRVCHELGLPGTCVHTVAAADAAAVAAALHAARPRPAAGPA